MLFYIVLICLICFALPSIIPDRWVVRYYACYLSFTAYCMTMASVYIPVFLLNPKSTSNISFGINPARIHSKLIGLDWTARNGRNTSVNKKGIVVMNHQSVFDTIAALYAWEHLDNATIVSRREVFYYWPFGLAIWLCGFIFIDRNNGKIGAKELSAAAATHMKDAGKILVFPEGTRNRTGKGLLPFKKGAFRLAIDHQVPILPIVVSPYYFISKKQFRRGKMIISHLEAIPTKGLTVDDVDMLLEKTKSIMLEEYEKLSKEIEPLR